jgi:hypothetical protein
MKCENENFHYEAFYQDPVKPDGVYYKGFKVGRVFLEYDLYFVGGVGDGDVCGLGSTLQAALNQYVCLHGLLFPNK